MARLIAARVRVALIPLRHWRGRPGLAGTGGQADLTEARRLARHIERGASRLPFEFKCLPRAMALSRMLARRGIAHRLTLAARPALARTGQDDLHAWIEVDRTIILGELPGPWVQLFSWP